MLGAILGLSAETSSSSAINETDLKLQGDELSKLDEVAALSSSHPLHR